MKLHLLGCLLIASIAHAEKSYVIQGDDMGDVSIHVVDFPSEENFGFEAFAGKRGLFISECYAEADHLLAFNGGYFDGNLNPVGYCRIANTDLSTEVAPRLSGYLTTSEEGVMELHWKRIPEGSYRDIIQSGPFIIDPGGKIGIHTRTGSPAQRTVVCQTTDGRILILTTTEVYLYDLARVIQKTIPDVDRALNLDGGPSVGLIYKDIVIENVNPIANVIRKLRRVEVV